MARFSDITLSIYHGEALESEGRTFYILLIITVNIYYMHGEFLLDAHHDELHKRQCMWNTAPPPTTSSMDLEAHVTIILREGNES